MKYAFVSKTMLNFTKISNYNKKNSSYVDKLKEMIKDITLEKRVLAICVPAKLISFTCS